MATEEMMGAAIFAAYAKEHGVEVTRTLLIATLDNGEWWVKESDGCWYRR